MDTWKPTTLDKNSLYKAEIGPLSLWMTLTDGEIHTAAQRLDESISLNRKMPLKRTEETLPEGVKLKRWVIKDNETTIRLAPVMPDRSLVAVPELPIKIPAEHEAVFFVGIPIWIRVQIENAKQVIISEEPTVVLSNTWFGDTMSGELCYSLSTRARRSFEEADPRIHRAICPIKVKNSATTQLEFQKVCIQASHLRTYRSKNQLWTNEVDMTYLGQDREIHMEFSESAPKYQHVEETLSEPRKPITKHLFTMSVSSLLSFAVH